MINNLAQLKKAMVKGMCFLIVGHCRPECIGQRRQVTIANTVGFYSIIPNEPKSKISLANDSRGSFLDWGKAKFWKFENSICYYYNCDTEQTPEHLIIAIKLKEDAYE